MRIMHGTSIDAMYDRAFWCGNCGQGKENKRKMKELHPKLKPELKVVPPKPQQPKAKPIPKPKKQRRDAVDWKDLMEGYNRIHGTKWNTVKRWLSALYKKHGTQKAAAAVLGVSESSLCHKMRDLKISGKQVSVTGKDRFLAIPESRMAEMKKLEIAAETGLGIGTVESLIYRHNRCYQYAGTWKERAN